MPRFLDQLCEELVEGPSETNEISRSAKKNGRDLLREHFTISQVVHGYGDVCQSVTDLAVERAAPITTDDFRTMNRCLDNAIAGAVTEYAQGHDVTRQGESSELRNLADAAIAAFKALQTGTVGFGGSTGHILDRNLRMIRALADRQHAALAPPGVETTAKA